MRRPLRLALSGILVAGVLVGLAALAVEAWRGRCAGCGWPRWPRKGPSADELSERGLPAGLAALDGPIHPTEGCYERWGEEEGLTLNIYAVDDLVEQLRGSCAANFRYERGPGQVSSEELERRMWEALPPHLARASADRITLEMHRGQLLVNARPHEHEEIERALRRQRDMASAAIVAAARADD